ncbi:DUF3311 domain-containing protein [uncultured Jatrophihabitans sp.]|uniref:DUF3311 domain-containing protein n=1 Tax=uncultured Jatrophihabitans sp. TaxID=1610747 RepID=UPI0035C94664
MSSAPEDEMVPVQPPARPPRLPIGVGIAVAVLLAIPCIALAAVPTYSSETPKLFGWPFFYWYQVMWVLITPVLTIAAYLLIKKAGRR